MMSKLIAVLFSVAVLSAPACLLLGCGASLSEVTHDAAAKVDEGAQKLKAVISSTRVQLKPYAAIALALCDQSPVDPAACAEIDSAASRVFEALDKASAALDLYEAGKGDFIDAYDAVDAAFNLAVEYAKKVVDLDQRSQV